MKHKNESLTLISKKPFVKHKFALTLIAD